MDALVIAIVLAALAGVLGLFFTKSSAALPRGQTKEQQCMANLQRISTALSAYSSDNAGRIPYAYIRYSNTRHSTWDALLDTRIRSNLHADGERSAGPSSRLPLTVLICPSDVVGKADWAANNTLLQRRSYSMSNHDMRPENWPPASGNSTGAGLWWNFGSRGELRPDKQVYNYENTNRQAAVTKSMILEPSRVMSIGEQVHANNLAYLSSRSTIATTSEHLQTNALPSGSLHGGRFNFLKFDGSVQLLSPEQSVGPVGKTGKDPKTHQGLWTLRLDD